MTTKPNKVIEAKPGLFVCEEVFLRSDMAVAKSRVDIVTGICPNCSNTHFAVFVEGTGISIMLTFDPRDAEEIGKRLISPIPLPPF